MEFTEEQKNYLADVYANGKSSSDVFRKQHKADFIAGFEKALSLFAVSGQSEQLNCDHEWRVDKFDCYGFPTEKYCDICGEIEAV